MAAPTPATWQAPTGVKLGDGFKTLISFTNDLDIALWADEITPPGWEGDEPVETTTMANDVLRTYSPGSLARIPDATYTALYDPAVYDQVMAIINDPTTITYRFPNQDTYALYGYLRSFVPDALSRGNRAQATVTVTFTNQDPTTCEEELPVYTAGTGTGGC